VRFLAEKLRACVLLGGAVPEGRSKEEKSIMIALVLAFVVPALVAGGGHTVIVGSVG